MRQILLAYGLLKDSIDRKMMRQKLQAYGLLKETVTAITLLYKNSKASVRLPNDNTDLFDFVNGVSQVDTLALYVFIIYRDYVQRTSIVLIKNGVTLKRNEVNNIFQKL